MRKFSSLLAVSATFLMLFVLVLRAQADNTCYAPVPVDCTTLSADSCNQAHTQYQSEASIYNTCISNNYTNDAQQSVVQTKINSYCSTARDVQSCISAYTACQVSAPTNSFGWPDNSGKCSYTCNSGYYLTISGSCNAQGVTPVPTPATTAAPAPV